MFSTRMSLNVNKPAASAHTQGSEGHRQNGTILRVSWVCMRPWCCKFKAHP